MGIPDEPFWSPPDLVQTYRGVMAERGAGERARWLEALDSVDAEERAAWDAAWSGTGTKGWEDALPSFALGEEMAMRQAMVKVLGASFQHFPGIVSGAADLTGNTGVKLPDDAGQQRAENPGGRQVYYGIREHTMGAAGVGMAMHGGVLPLAGTFFVFLDYMRPPVRLATVQWAKAIFVYSHDSVGVGEDGPTHQPVEHLATLRAIPRLQVIRPANANETVAAARRRRPPWPDGARAQPPGDPGAHRRLGHRARAGIVHEPGSEPRLVIVGTGSEVTLAIDAAQQLNAEGAATRAVSLPSWDRFAAQDEEYRHAVLPPGVPVLSVEAATTLAGSAMPTTRWASTASASTRPAARCSTSSGSTSNT